MKNRAITNSSTIKKAGVVTALVLASLATAHAASVAINIDVPDTRGNGDAGIPTIADFTSQNPGAGLTATTEFINSGGNTFGNGAGFTELDGLTTTDGFTFATTGTSNGFNAGDDSHNDLNPITEGYAYGVQGNTISISGLAALTNSGDQIILGLWGIGDNVGQGATFTTAYASLIAAEGNVQETIYNGPGQARSSAVGSVPFANYTYVADGTTDDVVITIAAGSAGGNAVINALSIAVVPVPEPSSAILISLGALTLLRRRR